MSKEDAIELIKLLSALECAGIIGKNLPDYLKTQIDTAVEKLQQELLKP